MACIYIDMCVCVCVCVHIDDACGFIFQTAPMVFYAFCMCFSKSTKDSGGGIYIILKYCEPILKNN